MIRVDKSPNTFAVYTISILVFQIFDFKVHHGSFDWIYFFEIDILVTYIQNYICIATKHHIENLHKLDDVICTVKLRITMKPLSLFMVRSYQHELFINSQ